MSVFTTGRHLSIPRAKLIFLTPSQAIFLRSILVVSYHSCLSLSSKLFPSNVPTKTVFLFLLSPYTCYMSSSSHLSSFHQPHNTASCQHAYPHVTISSERAASNKTFWLVFGVECPVRVSAYTQDTITEFCVRFLSPFIQITGQTERLITPHPSYFITHFNHPTIRRTKTWNTKNVDKYAINMYRRAQILGARSAERIYFVRCCLISVHFVRCCLISVHFVRCCLISGGPQYETCFMSPFRRLWFWNELQILGKFMCPQINK